MKTALIDGDSLPYICSKETIQESINNIDSIIKSICETTDCEQFIILLSKPPYFRLKYNSNYKGNRSSESPLKWLKTLKNYLFEGYNGFAVEGLEADDLCAYLKFQDPNNTVLCSIDKDILCTLEGRGYNYKKREWVESTKDQANYYLCRQMLMGDSTDNIQGLKKVGEKSADKILSQSTNLWNNVAQAYRKHYGEQDWSKEYINTYRQVYLMRYKEEYLEQGFNSDDFKYVINKIDRNDTDRW